MSNVVQLSSKRIALPEVAIIVAMDNNKAIGHQGAIPWRLPDDFANFKTVTLGHPVIMGRRTYESIGWPLPGRLNIVLSENQNPPWPYAPGVRLANSFQDACAIAGPGGKVFAIGGVRVYEEALQIATEMHVCRVNATVEADTYFPLYNPIGWRVLSSVYHPIDERHTYEFHQTVLQRARSHVPIYKSAPAG